MRSGRSTCSPSAIGPAKQVPTITTGRQCRSSGMTGSGGAAPNLTTVPELVGSVADEVAVEAENLPGVGCVPEDRSGQDDGPDGMEAETRTR